MDKKISYEKVLEEYNNFVDSECNDHRMYYYSDRLHVYKLSKDIFFDIFNKINFSKYYINEPIPNVREVVDTTVTFRPTYGETFISIRTPKKYCHFCCGNSKIIQFSMVEITDEGVYTFGYYDPVIQFYFTSNESLLEYGHSKDTYLFDTSSKYAGKRLNNPELNVSKENLAKIFNKIFREGLKNLSKKTSISLTDDTDYDSKPLNEEIKDINNHMGIIDGNINNRSGDLKIINYSNLSKEADIDKTVANLVSLKQLGVELSFEQESILHIYDLLNSEKFKKYKNERDLRIKKQNDAREKSRTENKKREEWLNSSDNPTNMKIEELKKLKTKFELLDDIRKEFPGLLSSEQKQFLDETDDYFKMIDLAASKKHEIDTGMDLEIREWYLNKYTEGMRKSKKIV